MYVHICQTRRCGPPEIVQHRIDLDGAPWATVCILTKGTDHERRVSAWLDRGVIWLNNPDDTPSLASACEPQSHRLVIEGDTHDDMVRQLQLQALQSMRTGI